MQIELIDGLGDGVGVGDARATRAELERAGPPNKTIAVSGTGVGDNVTCVATVGTGAPSMQAQRANLYTAANPDEASQSS